MLDAKGWAFLACRALALYTLYWAIRNASGLMAFFNMEHFRQTEFLLAVAFLLAQVGACLLFWFGAPWFSVRMVPNVPQKSAPESVTIEQMSSLLVSLLGLSLVVYTIPKIAAFLVTLQYARNPSLSERAIELAATFVVGLFLIVGRKKITQLIKTARELR